MKKFRCLMILLALVLAPLSAWGEPFLQSVAIDQPGGQVTYPRLDGHPDAMVQVLANQAILDKLQVQALLDEAAKPFNELRADYAFSMQSNVLSIVMKVSRENQTDFHTVTVDLNTGSVLTLEDFFPDLNRAIEAMEGICAEQIEPALSDHLENNQVLPLPMDQFFVTPAGLTIYYPGNQFSYFSGVSGSVSFAAYELKEALDTDPKSLAARVGWLDYPSPQADSAQKIREAVAAGKLPGIAPVIGDSLSQWLQAYGLLCDPDYYPGGRFFQTEAGEMRDIWLLTDDLTDDYDQSPVRGIRADRINLFGIQTGISSREAVVNLLGQPENRIELDANAAMDYYLPAGVSEYYPMGENMLRLHYKEGKLVSVQLLD